eukprot:5451625-Ditylum_brightwellii.AAC.1
MAKGVSRKQKTARTDSSTRCLDTRLSSGAAKEKETSKQHGQHERTICTPTKSDNEGSGSDDSHKKLEHSSSEEDKEDKEIT